jgi:hypothetical protein
MRSQVQVLAGPPTNPAGHSAGGSEPGTLAGGLGRAGAARPSRRHAHQPPPGPPPRAAGPMTTTHRGRPPSRGRQPRGRCGNLALRHRPTDPTRPRQRRPRPGLPGRPSSRSTTRQPIGTRPVPVVTVARRLDLVPTAAGGGRDGRVRTDGGGQQPAGHRTARHRTHWTPEGLDTGCTGHHGRTPDGWTAGPGRRNR